MRRLYAGKLVIISAVLIVMFSALFALLQSSARIADPATAVEPAGDPGTAHPDAVPQATGP